MRCARRRGPGEPSSCNVESRHPQLEVQPIVDWLIDGAKPASSPRDALRLACERMLEAGLRVHRVAVFVRPLHPNVAARAFYWREGSAAVEVNDEDHGFMSTDEQLASPIRVVVDTRQEIRIRLEAPEQPIEFPIGHELRADGFTDYLITPLEFMNGEVHSLSLATRGAGGFTDAEMAAVQRIKPALTRLVEIFGLTGKAANILDAYLGRHAGAKVLQGRIRRGDAEKIHAVIWFCDLRDSTMLAESLGPQGFLMMLNDYFECVLGPVLERSGEVLSFIGDAALAIFRVGGDPGRAATHAVDAAKDAMVRMQGLNERREKAGAVGLRFSIGLHLGDLLYGNVGTPTRIQFTVVGAAANEASRIEALCKTLDTSLLVSAQVANHASCEWRSVGRFQLRGVERPIELFTL
jgi:adenylate cyclase